MPELVAEPGSGPKTSYQPIIAKVNAKSQYKATEFSFHGLREYWDWQMTTDMQGQMPEPGKWYKVVLATKPKSQGDSLYHDVQRARLATEDEIPDSPPEPVNQPQTGSQGQPRDGGDEFRRNKVEMRWTEACHIAALIPGNGNHQIGDAFLDVANWIYQILVTGPDNPVAVTETYEEPQVPEEPPQAQEEDRVEF